MFTLNTKFNLNYEGSWDLVGYILDNSTYYREREVIPYKATDPIGAGTITCNYDGVYKHKTVIEDNVFVGSSTQLVAPVTVGEGATIGAGSTITQDVPGNELTLARIKQVTIKGWKKPQKEE